MPPSVIHYERSIKYHYFKFLKRILHLSVSVFVSFQLESFSELLVYTPNAFYISLRVFSCAVYYSFYLFFYYDSILYFGIHFSSRVSGRASNSNVRVIMG